MIGRSRRRWSRRFFLAPSRCSPRPRNALCRRTWRSTPPPPCAPQVELLDVAFPYVIAPSDWADPVVVRVVALDDALDERYRHNDAIRVTVDSLDPDYGGDDNTTLNVTILDDDASGGALAASSRAPWQEKSGPRLTVSPYCSGVWPSSWLRNRTSGSSMTPARSNRLVAVAM